MLDLKRSAPSPSGSKQALARRGAAEQVDELLALDARRRELLPEVEGAQAERKTLSKQIGERKQAGEDAEAEQLMATVAELKEKIESGKEELEEVDAKLGELALAPQPSRPRRAGRDDRGGRRRPPRGRRAARVRLRAPRPPRDRHRARPDRHGGGGAALRLALRLPEGRPGPARAGAGPLRDRDRSAPRATSRWSRRSWSAKRRCEGTGFLPGDRDQIYEIPKDDLFLTGTSEVALAGLHADEILDADALPLRYCAFSTCFRREAGAAGRDTRGIFRVHQFDKVEMFSFVEPDASGDEHERLLAIEERILGELEIPYRVVNVAVGDLGAPAAKKYDCEAWIPSQGRYRELTSCSNTTDYQARRLGARYRPAEGEAPQPVHTLNGTACAVGRTIIALIENRQESDGSFTLPKTLHPYGAPERIGAA